MDQSDWVWMPHPAHFICGHDCRFHLATCVGGYIVSTVGEYLPDSTVREIYAKSRGIQLEGRGDERLADWMKKVGYENIGCDRKYETMVFRAREATQKENRGCCPWIVSDYEEQDFEGYNDATEAYEGHLRLCEKWSKAEVVSEITNG